MGNNANLHQLSSCVQYPGSAFQLNVLDVSPAVHIISSYIKHDHLVFITNDSVESFFNNSRLYDYTLAHPHTFTSFFLSNHDLYVSEDTGIVAILDAVSLEIRSRIRPPKMLPGRITSMVLVNNSLYLGHLGGNVTEINTKTNEIIQEIQSSSLSPVQLLQHSLRYNLLCIVQGRRDEPKITLKSAKKNLDRDLTGIKGMVTGVLLFDDQNLVIAVDSSNNIVIWDLITANILASSMLPEFFQGSTASCMCKTGLGHHGFAVGFNNNAAAWGNVQFNEENSQYYLNWKGRAKSNADGSLVDLYYSKEISGLVMVCNRAITLLLEGLDKEVKVVAQKKPMFSLYKQEESTEYTTKIKVFRRNLTNKPIVVNQDVINRIRERLDGKKTEETVREVSKEMEIKEEVKRENSGMEDEVARSNMKIEISEEVRKILNRSTRVEGGIGSNESNEEKNTLASGKGKGENIEEVKDSAEVIRIGNQIAEETKESAEDISIDNRVTEESTIKDTFIEKQSTEEIKDNIGDVRIDTFIEKQSIEEIKDYIGDVRIDSQVIEENKDIDKDIVNENQINEEIKHDIKGINEISEENKGIIKDFSIENQITEKIRETLKDISTDGQTTEETKDPIKDIYIESQVTEESKSFTKENISAEVQTTEETISPIKEINIENQATKEFQALTKIESLQDEMKSEVTEKTKEVEFPSEPTEDSNKDITEENEIKGNIEIEKNLEAREESNLLLNKEQNLEFLSEKNEILKVLDEKLLNKPDFKEDNQLEIKDPVSTLTQNITEAVPTFHNDPITEITVHSQVTQEDIKQLPQEESKVVSQQPETSKPVQKKPQNPFQIFLSQKKPEILSENPSATHKEVVMMVTKLWSQLSESDKKKFES